MNKTFILNAIVTLVSLSAFADVETVICKGQAEYGAINIQEIKIASQVIELKYSVNNGAPIEKRYIITEYKKNGSTDAQKPAYFIGATESGNAKDFNDIALPRYGLYKDGKIGSAVAFQHTTKRVFGEVTCEVQ